MPRPPAPNGPPLTVSHPRSRTPSPNCQVVFPPQGPQVLPAVAVSAINATPAVGLPTTGPPSSEPQYPIRYTPPLGTPPSHLNYPTTSQARIDSPQSINSVSVQGHGVVPSARTDVGAANLYTDEANEEDIVTPVRPSEKAPDAELDEEDLRTSLTGVPLLSF